MYILCDYSAIVMFGRHQYPYGDEFKPNACLVGTVKHRLQLEPVKTRSECVGGLYELYDMGGSLSEWIATSKTSPSMDLWRVLCAKACVLAIKHIFASQLSGFAVAKQVSKAKLAS